MLRKLVRCLFCLIFSYLFSKEKNIGVFLEGFTPKWFLDSDVFVVSSSLLLVSTVEARKILKNEFFVIGFKFHRGDIRISKSYE